MLASSDFGNVLLNLLATAVGGLIGFFFKTSLLPWYQAAMHRGVSLSGTWTGEQTSPRGTFGFHLELSQTGPKVKGTFVSNDAEASGKKRSRTQLVEGEIHHNHLFLMYRNKDRAQVGLGGFLFAIREGGDQLVGSMLFLQTSSGNVSSSNDLKLERRSAR